MIGATNCPMAGQLEAFSAGCVTEDEADSIAEHISHCSRCVSALEAMSPNDTVIDAFRAQTVQSLTLPPADADRVEQIIQAAKQLFDSSNQSPDHSAKRPGSAYEIDTLQQLGDYRVVKLLGQGGMGAVFEAEDLQLQRRVAIKALLPKHAADPSARTRFLIEARAMAGLDNENIVPILHIGEEKGVPYFVMPLLAGETLEAKRRREGALQVSEILRIGISIADGLEASHRRSVVHRDIKPENVWLETKAGCSPNEFQVRLIDFGLAQNERQDIQLTQPGMFVGTPAYMAPEQANGLPATARSDLFSLGSVLYVLASGELPFPGATAIATLRAVAQQRAAPIGELRPDLPKALVAVIEKLHAKDPARRFATAADVAIELRRIAEGPTSVNRTDHTRNAELGTRNYSRRVRRSWRKLATGVLLVLAGFGICEAAGITHIRKAFKADPPAVATGPSVPDSSSPPPGVEPPLATHETGVAKIRPLEFKTKAPVERVVPIPESSALLFTCRDDATLYGINELGATVEIGRHDGPIRALCCSPDGSRAVTGGDDGMVRVWSVGDARPRGDLTVPKSNYFKLARFEAPYGLMLYQDGMMVFDEANNKKEAVRFGKPGHRVIWGFKNTLDKNPELAKRMGAALTDSVYAFDKALTLQLFEGGTLLCEFKSGRITWTNNAASAPPPRLSPLSRCKSLFTLKQHTAPVIACSISPDGDRAVSIGADSLLCEWNIENGKLLRQFTIPASLAVAYLDDGKSVLLGTKDESATIVDLHEQKRVRNLTGHQGKVNAVAADHKYLFTAGDDGDIRIWHAATGELFRMAIRHKSPILSLTRMLNGEFLAAKSGDGHVCFWDATYIAGRFVGECAVNENVHAVGFNELSDHLVLGMAADDGAGVIKYVSLKFTNALPPTVTLELPESARAVEPH